MKIHSRVKNILKKILPSGLLSFLLKLKEGGILMLVKDFGSKVIRVIWVFFTAAGIPVPKKILNKTMLIQLRLYQTPISLDKLYVLTTITHDYTLLPHFINYYKS